MPPLYLAVALDGVGWHPAAWREADVDARDVFRPRYWVGLIQEAEWAGLDFVTIQDSLLLQSTSERHPEGRTDRVLGRLDAVLVAARAAPGTTRVGIIPVATTTHTEPFHISKAIATLDYVSRGRAGLPGPDFADQRRSGAVRPTPGGGSRTKRGRGIRRSGAR